ncbi:tigger transposable element-derived protein 4-like [Belonocnema kinseyi]|uniref:tigger transposable element-derived protein 4-like n=1 Tax=Belonocnema kinseyi TaxID=2817044 RepID=UPI00143D95A7|nr:tigger transposable element-derived protein 4-like [Belonocnema kinseyi]
MHDEECQWTECCLKRKTLNTHGPEWRALQGEEERHHLQPNQSLRHQEEELHVKDAMGQLPAPVKSIEDHSQNVNETMDVNQTSDNEKKESNGSDKLRPLVIGKSAKPRCFKNVRYFPCEYSSQRRAWMTSDRYRKWLVNWDEKLVTQKCKIILFVDNFPSHPKEVLLKNIRLEFLPPNAKTGLQPLDQAVIKVVKQKYRKRIVEKFLDFMQDPITKPKINVLDAMHWVTASWEDIEPETIQNFFRKAVLLGEIVIRW